MARSVLIVDDDAAFRDLASRVVTGWGHHLVGSVAEALARAAELRPDTALVEIGLPDGDGFVPKDEVSGAGLRRWIDRG